MAGLNGDWYEALKEEFKKPYYKKLFETVKAGGRYAKSIHSYIWKKSA